MIQKVQKLAKCIYDWRVFQNEITKGKIHAEQFSEEEKLLKFTDIAIKSHWVPWKRLLRCWMYRKQFGYYLQFGLLWNGRFFGYEKNIMKSVCKWVKIPYFLKLELLIPTTAIAAGTSCRHQILTEPIESTTSSFYIKELFKKITRLNLGLSWKKPLLNFIIYFFWDLNYVFDFCV
jgi:hypothetical protein